MPLLSKKASTLKKFNEQRKDESVKSITEVTRFVFSSIVFSMEFSAAAGFTLLNNIIPPSESAYYKAEKNVVTTLLKMAQDEVNENLNNLEDNAIISLDGSWGTKRQSRTFILDAIDIATHKIVAFVLEDKGDKENPYKGASNMMESAAFKKIAPILKATGKIRAIVKDGDTKLANIARNIGWNVSFIQDPQHLKKNFGTLFAKYNKLANGKLRGLKDKIIKHINYVLYSDKTPDEKKSLFLNLFQHFSGNHAECTHDKDAGIKCKIIKESKALDMLKDVLQQLRG